MSRTYGNKTPVRYTDRTRQTIAEDWNDVSTDVENILDQLAVLTHIVSILDPDNIASSPAITTEQIEVFDVDQGIYEDDNIIEIGTPLQTILKNMLQKVVHPTYILPVCNIGNNVTSSRMNRTEIGVSIDDVLSTTWTQNNAGAMISYEIRRNSGVINSGSSALSATYNPGSQIIGESDLTYELIVNYEQGGILNNNMNEADLNGRIEAGVVNNTIVYKGGNRRIFFRCDEIRVVPTNETELRNVGIIDNTYDSYEGDKYSEQDIINWNNSKDIDIDFPRPARRIVIAFPQSLGTLNGILDKNNNNIDISSSILFTKTVFDVNGENNQFPIAYDVYTYIPSSAQPTRLNSWKILIN